MDIRWDTVQSLPRFDDSANAGVWPTGRSSTSPAVPGLLAVDVLKLADGTGFAGNLAAIVESTAGCTYRVVLGGDGEGEGGGVTVHVSFFLLRAHRRRGACAFSACCVFPSI